MELQSLTVAQMVSGWMITFSMSDKELNDDLDSNSALQEATPKLKKPPLYKVLLLNDDYTPMDFVVQVLQVFFSMTTDKATEIMLHVHTRGVGVCGVYARDVAETKVAQVNQYSRENQHPLKCTLEKA
jgi:ATP-dependent Clp protease adaptor protein ClpS